MDTTTPKLISYRLQMGLETKLNDNPLKSYTLEDYNFFTPPPERPPRRHKRILSEGEWMSKTSKLYCNNPAHLFEPFQQKFTNNNHNVVDVSVQTLQLLPYRLRFWPECPRRSSNLMLSTPDSPRRTCHCQLSICVRILTQCLLSQVGLTILLIVWALLGAFAFYKTEGPREHLQSVQLAQLQHAQSRDLTNRIVSNPNPRPDWLQQLLRSQFEKHQKFILEAVSAGYGEGGDGNIWTYPGCVLFAVALLTTLGFGAPVPRTAPGRLLAILFAAIGIPLHFLLILNVGNLGAVRIQRLAPPTDSKPCKWLRWLPLTVACIYYGIGVLLFGVVRGRGLVDCFMFPLDFTAAGGVATTQGHVRVCYAIYLECAVTLAAILVSLIQTSATRGIVGLGLKYGLLTNT